MDVQASHQGSEESLHKSTKNTQKQTSTHKTSDKSNDHQDHDSKTVDVSLFERIRQHDDRLTVRINKRLKEAIKRHVKAKGLSICHINDALWVGYLLGWNEKLDLDVKSPTINLTLVRDVKRIRRYAFEEIEETVRFPEACRFCGRVVSQLYECRFISGLTAFVCEDCLEEKRRQTLLKNILKKVTVRG